MSNDSTFAFYPGAGMDLTPPVLFPEIKTWRYMDRLGSSYFLSALDRIMNQCGFELQKTEENLLIYFSSSTAQTIFYEINTLFPLDWNRTKHAPHNSTLILCGYDIESERYVSDSFFASYSHIVTNSITVESIFEQNILPFHTFAQIEFPPSSTEYWLPQNKTKAIFQKLYTVKK